MGSKRGIFLSFLGKLPFLGSQGQIAKLRQKMCIVLYCIGCCPYTSFVFYRRGYRSICLESRYHFSVKVL